MDLLLEAGQRPAKGSICLTCPMLVSCTVTAPRRWRLFFVDFLVRMWRLNAWARLTVPPGRTRKRFFAPLLVFILGMTAPFDCAAGAGGVRRLVGLQTLLKQRPGDQTVPLNSVTRYDF